MSVTLPAGLESVFSVGHPMHSRIFWDKLVGQYYDMGVDLYLEVDDLPRFGLAAREASPVVAVHPAGWDVDTITKYGKRCLRYCRTIGNQSYMIEQSSSCADVFSAYRWSNDVGLVSITSSSSAAECARRVEAIYW